jgi:NitT/TauT family transport system substrate-binding protein
MTKASELIRNDPGAAGQILQERYFLQTALELVKHTVSDQRMTVAVPPRLSEQQFAHNMEFELKFSDAVRGVTYQQAINPRWLGA